MANQEIERKFLVSKIPADLLIRCRNNIQQGYVAIAEDGTEVRVRNKGERYYLTAKAGQGLVRSEVEIELQKDQFDALWKLTEGKRVEKTRIEIKSNDHKIEVDLFRGKLNGLILAEIEFTSVEEAAQFVMPAWFGLEVTDDPRFKNRNLAVSEKPYGFPSANASGP